MHLFISKSLFFLVETSTEFILTKIDLDAKEFCKLSLLYYLTWWRTELKSTMTKENASFCITPGKEQGMSCQTDSLNTYSLVILKLLAGSETDFLPLAHLASSWACRKRLQLLLFFHLVSRRIQSEFIFVISMNHSPSGKNKPPLFHHWATYVMTYPLPLDCLCHPCNPNKSEPEHEVH